MKLRIKLTINLCLSTFAHNAGGEVVLFTVILSSSSTTFPVFLGVAEIIIILFTFVLWRGYC